MTRDLGSDLVHCKNLVCTRTGLLTVTHRFFPPDVQQKLLSIHALFEAVRSIPFSVSDPAVGRAKIAWWCNELAPDARVMTQHPIIRACQTLGVFQFFRTPQINAYMTEWAQITMGDPVPDIQVFSELVLRLGAIEANAELNLLAENRDEPELKNTGAVMEILNFLGRFNYQLGGESWWLPLDIQARCGVTFDGLKSVKHKPGLQKSISLLCDLGLEFCKSAKLELIAIKSPELPICHTRHLETCLKISERRLQKLRERPDRLERFRITPSEMFFAWYITIKQQGFLVHEVKK